MAIFITGATGFIGSYVVAELLREHQERLALLVRARSIEEAEKRLWMPLQLHLDFERFIDLMKSRVDVYLGDLTRPQLGLCPSDRARLIDSTESVIHLGAALNRRSDKVCFNVNLRGTLEVIKLARSAHEDHGLRRFSSVSTSAVCGERRCELIAEAQSVDWRLEDYDPYARTKKFGELMVSELLPDVSTIVFRPSTVMGDSRFAETIEFDMVRAFVVLAHLPVLPLDPKARHDIVPVDFVARSIATIHQREKPKYDIYHLSAGRDSLSYQEMIDAMRIKGFRIPHLFVPRLGRQASAIVNYLATTPKNWGVSLPATLLKMFWPYLIFDTVFDNQRVKEEMGESPTPFSEYAYRLLQFAVKHNFSYPYKPWPETTISKREDG
ncbi:MAG: SDR family oxidoreductase [Deltaproteobacteria bacterium]|nr:SDR family oxidoreductase [Deltaproteobacteria bacterium]